MKNSSTLLKVRNALILVSDCISIRPVISHLSSIGVIIYSQGKTLKKLRKMGFNIKDASSDQKSKVLTDHGINVNVLVSVAADPRKLSHKKELLERGLPHFDLVICDQPLSNKNLNQVPHHPENVIDDFDVATHILLSMAARNYKKTCVLFTKDQYSNLLEDMIHNDGGVSLQLRLRFSESAIARVTLDGYETWDNLKESHQQEAHR